MKKHPDLAFPTFEFLREKNVHLTGELRTPKDGEPWVSDSAYTVYFDLKPGPHDGTAGGVRYIVEQHLDGKDQPWPGDEQSRYAAAKGFKLTGEYRQPTGARRTWASTTSASAFASPTSGVGCSPSTTIAGGFSRESKRKRQPKPRRRQR